MAQDKAVIWPRLSYLNRVSSTGASRKPAGGWQMWGVWIGTTGRVGFRVPDMGFGFRVSGFRVSGFGLRVKGLRFGV